MKTLIMTLFLSINAQSGELIGNGGDIVVCPNKTEVLDLYQAREQFKLPIDLGNDQLNYQDKVEFAISRLEKVSPERAKNFRAWFSVWNAEAEYLPNITLVDIPDTGAQTIPSDCHLEQIAVQRAASSTLPGEKRYTINLDLWSGLDEINKAALVLHELSYREAIESGNDTPSSRVRYFNAHLLSSSILQSNQKKLALDSNLRFYEVPNDLIEIRYNGDFKFYDLTSKNGLYSVEANLFDTPVNCKAIGVSRTTISKDKSWESFYDCKESSVKVNTSYDGQTFEVFYDLTKSETVKLTGNPYVTIGTLAKDILFQGKLCSAGSKLYLSEYPIESSCSR